MKEIKLRDYQIAGVEGIRDSFKRKILEVLFVLPTGGGKTYTFCYIGANAAARSNRTLIVVHRKELLLQASKSLRALGIDHGMISPHFTASPHKMIQVASIDTLLIRIKKTPEKYRFKLVIFDEAHHVTDKNKWGKLIELLEAPDGGDPNILGVTATPKRGDGVGLGVGHGGIFREMVVGPSVAELIDWGMLINPIVYTSLETPDLSGLKTNKEGDYNLQDIADRVDKPKITGSAVQHYKDICPGARAIVFCASIKHAEHVVAEFNAAGYKFSILVGEPAMSDAERTAVNKALASGELHGACTVDLVSEGYDLPDLGCCIMLRPTASESLFLQQVGRVMRPSPGKKFAYLLDHVGNVGRRVGGVFLRKHGLPSDHRDWSLEGRKKKKRKGDIEEADVSVKQCPTCYHVFSPAPACPKCGQDMTPKGRELEQVEGELHRITPEMEAQIKRAKKIEVGRARTMEELEKIEKDRGYKRGWAKMVFETRKNKAA